MSTSPTIPPSAPGPRPEPLPRILAQAGVPAYLRREIYAEIRSGESPAEAIISAQAYEEGLEALVPDWPTCSCASCGGCDEPATTLDDGGALVCSACADYAVDDDGEVYCSRRPEVEEVVETCGAGGQVHSYWRLRPPDEPEQDPLGEWSCYWESASSEDEHVVSQHATREQAEQACRAKDWPPPGDHTAYLCGYAVRRLVRGRWVGPDDDDC